jgi:RNA polymerase sigma factor (sigma-70 family)
VAVDPFESDAVAIEASIKDPARFGVVFDRHGATLHRYLLRRVGSNDADALLGDVFRIAFESRARYDTARPDARPWLYGIATNLVARHRRRHVRQEQAMARYSAAVALDSHRVDVAVEVIAGLEFADTVRRLSLLPAGERDALVLHAWEALSYAEIATVLAVPVGTVRSRINRARQRLQDLPLRRLDPVIHPDHLRRKKDQLMTDITGTTPERFEQRSRVYARLAYRDELAALGYLTRVFGLVERREARVGTGGPEDHMMAWLEFGAGLVMISHINTDIHRIHSPADLGGTTTLINVEVDNVDAHYTRAVNEGATITTELADTFYGARRYEASDIEGHQWHFEETHDHIRTRGGHIPIVDTTH